MGALIIQAEMLSGSQTKNPGQGELTGAGLVVREGDVQPSRTTTQAADSPVKSNGKPRPLVSDREMSQLNERPRPVSELTEGSQGSPNVNGVVRTQSESLSRSQFPCYGLFSTALVAWRYVGCYPPRFVLGH